MIKKARRMPPLAQTLAPARLDDVLELDELWSFVARRKNKRWVWLALCRRTRQIVAYAVGGFNSKVGLIGHDKLPSVVTSLHGVFGSANPILLWRNVGGTGHRNALAKKRPIKQSSI